MSTSAPIYRYRFWAMFLAILSNWRRLEFNWVPITIVKGPGVSRIAARGPNCLPCRSPTPQTPDGPPGLQLTISSFYCQTHPEWSSTLHSPVLSSLMRDKHSLSPHGIYCPSTCITSSVNGSMTVNLLTLDVLMRITSRGIGLINSLSTSIPPRLTLDILKNQVPLGWDQLFNFDSSSLAHFARICNDETLRHWSDEGINSRPSP